MNVIVFSQSGEFPQASITRLIFCVFLHRPLKMQPGRTGKSVYDTLCNLNNQGFRTSISKAYEVSWLYDINIDSYIERGGYVRPFIKC